MRANPFKELKARYLIFLMFLSFILSDSILTGLVFIDEWYWQEVIWSYLTYSFLLTGLIILSKGFKGSILQLIGRDPGPVPFKNIAGLTVKLFVFSIGSVYLLYYPLALLAPELVEALIIEVPALIYSDHEEIYILANILGFISIVIITPVIEELIFRGFILHRWAYKWGMYKSVIYSSLLFGVMHIDILGAFLFAFAMSVIYLNTRSLVLPILCHMLNNFIAWSWVLVELNVYGLEHEYSLDDFFNEWWLGAICLGLTARWAWKYFRNNLPGNDWTLPYFSYHRINKLSSNDE